ncbi:MAG: hypothetical protein JST40_10295 [Armatimonadetes bacterium]|nr:hypothetical protein [Armatimonadota bacterium]
MKESDLPAPIEVGGSETILRRAKLFESGDYADKGVSVTADDLKRLEINFKKPVPVLIEHADSPLELGYLTQVSAEGEELFGLIQLSREANELIERSGARALSLGLSRDLTRIREVSIVKKPRVPSAQLFSEDAIQFEGELGEIDYKALFEFSERVHRTAETEDRLTAYLQNGQLTPAQIPFARALLNQAGSIQFDGNSVPLSQLLTAMIERQPPHVLFKETAPTPSATNSALLMPEEQAFYQRYFPEISLDEIAQRKQS